MDKRTAIDIFSITLAVLALGVAVYFGLEARKNSSVSYAVEPIKVVDGENAKGISVSDERGNKVVGDVYAATVSIWNSGDIAFDHNDIRVPMSISTPNGRILSYSKGVISKSVLGLDENWLNITRQSEPIGKLVIDTTHFDPKAGIQLFIVYTGQRDGLQVSGSFLNVPQLKQEHNRQERESFGAFFRHLAVASLIFIVLMIIVIQGAMRFAPSIKYNNTSSSNNSTPTMEGRTSVTIILVVTPVLFGIVVFLLALSEYMGIKGQPFPFN